MRLEDDRKTVAMLTGEKYRYEATKASLAIVMILATLLLISSCQAGSLSPRTALEAPLELSNNTELKAMFVTRIDGEFWIEIRYTREFHFSQEHPAPLTEFSASYIIKQNGNIVQKGGFGLGAKVPCLMSRPYYGADIGKFLARRGVEYEITIRLGADVPNGLPKSATVDIFLDPHVPYLWWRGW
jgi:hypothetical protein